MNEEQKTYKTKKAETQIVELEVSSMIGADWNYKSDGTEEQIDKLIASIEKDASAGVLAVRELQRDGKTVFEVIDGNHRFQAIKKMGWERVACENFGEISIGTAVIIARRRNAQWFSDDIFKLQQVMNDEVFKEYSIEDLEQYMPDSRGFLESLQTVGELPWDKAQTDTAEREAAKQAEDQAFTEFKIKVPNETMAVWERLKTRYADALGEDQPDYRVLEFALIEALNVPEEALRSTKEDQEEISYEA